MSSKLAVITGASKGIGKSTALTLANEGFEIIATARNREQLNQVVNQINSQGGQGSYCDKDLSNPSQLQELLDFIKKKNKQIDLLVHAAGRALVAKLNQMKLEQWQEVITTNLEVPFHLTQKCLPLMQKGSHIIFINSVAGKNVFAEWGAYAASKHGLKAIADTLRLELRDQGIKITTIFPASVDTPLHDNLPYDWNRQKMLKPEQVASVILYCYKQPAEVAINELDLENFAGTF